MSKQSQTAEKAQMQENLDARQIRQRSEVQCPDTGDSGAGFPGPAMNSEAGPAVTHSELIQQAVVKRRELWDDELEAAKNACIFAESSKQKKDTLKIVRGKLWSVLWAMHVSGIADGSEELRILRRKELEDSDLDERVVSGKLKQLEIALAAVTFMPLEARLQVVTECPYPKEPNLAFYDSTSKDSLRQLRPQYVAGIVKGAELYSVSINNWQYENGSLLLDPIVPLQPVLIDRRLSVFDQTQLKNSIRVSIHENTVSSLKLLKDQLSSALLVTYNPEIVDEQQKRSIHKDFLPKPPPKTWEEREYLKKNPPLPGTPPRTREKQTFPNLSIIPLDTKPSKEVISECFFPLCNVCKEKILEPGYRLCKERRLRIAPEDELKLQHDQTADDISYLRSLEKTVYSHHDCLPDFIGYCFACRKPFMNEAEVLRFADHFIFHRSCLPSCPNPQLAASAAATGGEAEKSATGSG